MRVIPFGRAVQYVSKSILKSIICLEIKSKFPKPDRAKRDGVFRSGSVFMNWGSGCIVVSGIDSRQLDSPFIIFLTIRAPGC